MENMQSFKTNDNVTLKYFDTGAAEEGENEKPWLILIHGFTGSSQVWQRNLPSFSKEHRVIIPDLRGHGSSSKPKHGYHVSRLAMDLRELLIHLEPTLQSGTSTGWKAIGGSLGCSILWCYAELFTTAPFESMIFVDQSPLQNSTLDGWDSRFCNRGLNNAAALAALQTTLLLSPEAAHKGTITSCLSYRSHPLPTDAILPATQAADEAFFLQEALKGEGEWLGKLMADHTSLDWRDSIAATFGPGSGSKTVVLVVASNRSGCFPAAGPLKVIELVNQGAGPEYGLAQGVAVEWGGHWCYWEDPAKFARLVTRWWNDGSVD
ncbi:alpha/beta hydrolase-like protein [Stipitochalara longipes BDJ]|nr:alpha/beta hydrolase-like protein [Stipitochalara longipes BDJ]